MGELLKLISTFQFKKLFIDPTENNVIQFFRYCFVGGIATVVEGLTLWCVQHFVFSDENAVFVFISQVIAFVLGTTTNFILSRIFVFKESKKTMKITGEFIMIFAISAIGLLVKELLLWCFHVQIGIHYMIVWVFSTIIVLFWNYAARRVILYRKKEDKE